MSHLSAAHADRVVSNCWGSHCDPEAWALEDLPQAPDVRLLVLVEASKPTLGDEGPLTDVLGISDRAPEGFNIQR